MMPSMTRTCNPLTRAQWGESFRKGRRRPVLDEAKAHIWMREKKGQLAKPAGRQPKGPKGPHATPRHHLPRSQESFMGGTTPKPTEIACTVWWGRRRGGHAWWYPPSSVLYLWKLQKNTHAYTEARAEKGALERTRLRASCNKLAGQPNRHKGGLGALHSRMWMCCVAHESSKGPSCGATQNFTPRNITSNIWTHAWSTK